MKKFVKTLICLFLVAIVSVSVIACKKGGAGGGKLNALSIDERGNYTGGRHIREVGTTDYDFIVNKRSDYVGVLSSEAGADLTTAFSELNALLRDATGVMLPKVTDEAVAAGQKYISIGWTVQAKAAVAAGTLKVPGYKWDSAQQKIVSDSSTTALRANGFIIETVGENIFIIGGADVGHIFGVYQLMKIMFNYTQYTYEIYYIDKDVENLKLPDIHYVEDPDIGERMANWGCIYYNQQAAHRLGYRTQYAEVLVSDYHTAFTFLNPNDYFEAHPEWYNSGTTQLCYTAHGNKESYDEMVEEMARVMWDLLKMEPQKNNITLSQMDITTWCGCDDTVEGDGLDGCKDTIADYAGAPMATQLFFANDVTERIEQYRQDEQPDRLPIIVHIFAYHLTIPAPVEANKVDGKWVPANGSRGVAKGVDNLSIYMAIYGSQNYQMPMEHRSNATAITLIEQYGEIANHLSFWPYTTYFDNWFVPFDSFTANQNHYKYYAAAGAEILFNQGQHSNNAASCFSHLKTFLFGVWGWDVNVDYNTLTDAYFENVFGSKDGAMRKMYEEQRAYNAYRIENGTVGLSIYGSGIGPNCFPTQMLFQWMDYCDQALEEIAPIKDSDPERYEKMHKAIILESLQPRYFIARYHVNLLPMEEGAAFRRAFKEDCIYTGLNRESEGALILQSIESWG